LAAERGHEVVVKLLLSEDNVDPESKDEHGRTPLSSAVGAGEKTVMKPPFAKGWTYPGCEDHYGQTPLSRAAANVSWPTSKGYEAVVELLLVKDGVDRDSEDNEGRTPLSWAAWSGYGAAVKVLLAKDGVDPDSKDEDGGGAATSRRTAFTQTARMNTVERRFTQIIRFSVFSI
jgi:ankyrin repeat protein